MVATCLVYCMVVNSMVTSAWLLIGSLHVRTRLKGWKVENTVVVVCVRFFHGSSSIVPYLLTLPSCLSTSTRRIHAFIHTKDTKRAGVEGVCGSTKLRVVHIMRLVFSVTGAWLMYRITWNSGNILSLSTEMAIDRLPRPPAAPTHTYLLLIGPTPDYEAEQNMWGGWSRVLSGSMIDLYKNGINDVEAHNAAHRRMANISKH